MNTITDEQRRERFEVEMKQIQASIEEMRANNALASKKVRWYEVILIAAGTAGLISLGLSMATILRQ